MRKGREDRINKQCRSHCRVEKRREAALPDLRADFISERAVDIKSDLSHNKSLKAHSLAEIGL
jgi:hypothetical protein